MLYKTDEQIDAEKAELEGATWHKLNDYVNVEGTGRFEDMPKGKRFERVHRLAAKELVRKGYATVVA